MPSPEVEYITTARANTAKLYAEKLPKGTTVEQLKTFSIASVEYKKVEDLINKYDAAYTEARSRRVWMFNAIREAIPKLALEKDRRIMQAVLDAHAIE